MNTYMCTWRAYAHIVLNACAQTVVYILIRVRTYKTSLFLFFCTVCLRALCVRGARSVCMLHLRFHSDNSDARSHGSRPGRRARAIAHKFVGKNCADTPGDLHPHTDTHTHVLIV